MKNANFYRNGRYPEFPLLVQLWRLFPPEKDGRSKKKIEGKNSAIELSRNQVLSLLHFKWKIELLFGLFERFLVKIWAGSKVKGSEWKSNLVHVGAMYPKVLNMQRFWSHHFPIWSFSITNVLIKRSLISQCRI